MPENPPSRTAGINRHLRREALWMGIGLLGVLLLLAAVVGWLGPWVLRQVEVDRCLDAGGRVALDGGCEPRGDRRDVRGPWAVDGPAD